MKILMVSPELDPFVKVGGLGDAVGALAKSLARHGHDVRCVCPLYGSIKRAAVWTRRTEPLGADLGSTPVFCAVHEATLPSSNAKVYFLEHEAFYGRPEVYSGPWGPHADNDRRFAFLSRAALNLCLQLDWIPDIVHCHDWTTGLVPVFLNTTLRASPLGGCATVFTIHNLEHQGYCHRSLLAYAHLPEWLFTPDNLEACGAVNLMKAGLYHATKLTTVSPNYAREIQTPAFGCGLDHVLRFRAADLVGIVNGIDDETWNPATDPLLPANYSAADLAGKAECKAALQSAFGLEPARDVPVFGVVSRLFHQKGLDLLAEVLPRTVTDMRVQFAILGTGEPELERAFARAAWGFPGRVGAKLAFDNRIAHLIQGGSDCFVMPSRTEPCGLTQLYAMRYGTLPVARATGGLVDTITQYNETAGTGTGFLFEAAEEDALYYTLGWACSTYYDRPEHFAAMRLAAMARDFSWTPSTRRYEEVYRWAISARRGT